MASEFKIQVVHASNGMVVEWAPGLSVEKDLETELLARIKAKGVGVGRTSAHVLEDVKAALRELLYELKSQV